MADRKVSKRQNNQPSVSVTSSSASEQQSLYTAEMAPQINLNLPREYTTQRQTVSNMPQQTHRQNGVNSGTSVRVLGRSRIYRSRVRLASQTSLMGGRDGLQCRSRPPNPGLQTSRGSINDGIPNQEGLHLAQGQPPPRDLNATDNELILQTRRFVSPIIRPRRYRTFGRPMSNARLSAMRLSPSVWSVASSSNTPSCCSTHLVWSSSQVWLDCSRGSLTPPIRSTSRECHGNDLTRFD